MNNHAKVAVIIVFAFLAGLAIIAVMLRELTETPVPNLTPVPMDGRTIVDELTCEWIAEAWERASTTRGGVEMDHLARLDESMSKRLHADMNMNVRVSEQAAREARDECVNN